MRLAPTALLCLVAALPVRLLAQGLPPIATQGLNFLVSGESDSAVAVWTRTWTLPEDVAKRQQLLDSFRELPRVVGPTLGYDLIRTVDITPHLRRAYFLLRARQPVYLLLVLYQAQDRWMVTTVNWHTDADHVLPATLSPVH